MRPAAISPGGTVRLTAEAVRRYQLAAGPYTVAAIVPRAGYRTPHIRLEGFPDQLGYFRPSDLRPA